MWTGTIPISISCVEHFASIPHGCLFRNALAWEEYWRWDEDDTNVAVYYNTKDKPCGFMVYLIKNDIMHIKEMIYLNREAKKGLWEYIPRILYPESAAHWQEYRDCYSYDSQIQTI